MTNYVPLPDGPVTEGRYHDGRVWRAFNFDEARVRVVVSEGAGRGMQLFQPHYDTKEWVNMGNGEAQYLLPVVGKWDRTLYPEFIAWFDSLLSTETLSEAIKNDYNYCHSSWKKLLAVEPITTLKELQQWLEAQNDVEVEGETVLFRRDHNKLRFYFEDDCRSLLISYGSLGSYAELRANNLLQFKDFIQRRKVWIISQLNNYTILKEGLSVTS